MESPSKPRDDPRAQPQKPTIFIGCAVEALEIAQLIELNLAHDAEVTIWDEGLFLPGDNTLERLEDIKLSFDVAVLLFTADDVTVIRGASGFSPRDNVVFELGLFVGALGRSRAFFLYDRSNPPNQPSDLKGITPITFDSRRADGNLQSALRPACTQLLQAAKRVRLSRVRHANALSPAVYWAAPHANVERNAAAVQQLRACGHNVSLPYELVSDQTDVLAVRTRCRQALDSADLVVVDLETYGLDTAWEIGYADAHGKMVVGWNPDGRGGSTRKRVHRRLYSSCFMHGWDSATISDDLLSLGRHAHGPRRVLACAPFRNAAGLEEVRTTLTGLGLEVIVPRNVLDAEQRFPEDYPNDARRRTLGLQRECDDLLVILPRYGMDTAWQIGFGAGLGQQLLGWMSDDDGAELVSASAFEHWMHGWSSRPCLTSMWQLAGLLSQYQVG